MNRDIVERLPKKPYYTAAEVQNILGVSRDKSYKIVRGLREELVAKGKLTDEYPKGKIPRRYFDEKCMIG